MCVKERKLEKKHCQFEKPNVVLFFISVKIPCFALSPYSYNRELRGFWVVLQQDSLKALVLRF